MTRKRFIKLLNECGRIKSVQEFEIWKRRTK